MEREKKSYAKRKKAPQNLLCNAALCLVSRWLCICHLASLFCFILARTKWKKKIKKPLQFSFWFTSIAVCFCICFDAHRIIVVNDTQNLLSSFHRSNVVKLFHHSMLHFEIIWYCFFLSLLVCNHECVRVPMRVIQLCFCFGGFADVFLA